MIRCPDERDALALAALLNSRLVAAWLNALAEPARGGYRRYLAWTVAQLPLPPNWSRARASLSVMSHADDEQLLQAVVAAYGVTIPDVTALLDWQA